MSELQLTCPACVDSADVEPADGDVTRIEGVASELLSERLTGQTYDPTQCKRLAVVVARDLLGRLQAELDTEGGTRKLVTVVSIGSGVGTGAPQFGSRCLWDAATDMCVTASYSNASLFAVALIFLLHSH